MLQNNKSKSLLRKNSSLAARGTGGHDFKGCARFEAWRTSSVKHGLRPSHRQRAAASSPPYPDPHGVPCLLICVCTLMFPFDGVWSIVADPFFFCCCCCCCLTIFHPFGTHSSHPGYILFGSLCRSNVCTLLLLLPGLWPVQICIANNPLYHPLPRIQWNFNGSRR